jgi:hypothetical protein
MDKHSGLIQIFVHCRRKKFCYTGSWMYDFVLKFFEQMSQRQSSISQLLMMVCPTLGKDTNLFFLLYTIQHINSSWGQWYKTVCGCVLWVFVLSWSVCLYRLVWCWWVRPKPTWMSHLSGAPLQGRFLALPTSVWLDWKGLQGANTLAYRGNL